MASKSTLAGVFAIAAAAVAALAINATTAAARPAHDTRVLVVNSTNHTLTNLYASRTSDRHYHGDWLGDRELAPGQSMVIDFDDGTGACMMDIKGVFSDDTDVERSFDVCAEPKIEFTGD
ncbi:MAG TPA: hypothetical protein VFE13_14470 [Caulobacteraceae bacterium]|jgi:hypothetical protein|nr:hypothetical protein [Caulobacteraceae bacterium]